MNAHPLIFCATGVLHTTGGIASANRNVLAALETVAAEQGRQVETLTLSEKSPPTPSYRSFNGSKFAFSLSTVNAFRRAALVVFDHVHIARPLQYVPRTMRPLIVICAHGSEAGKRIRGSSIDLYQTADLVLTNSSFTLANMQKHAAPFNGTACPLGLPPQHTMTTQPPLPFEKEIVLTAADGRARPLGRRAMLLVARMDAGEREKGHRELMAVMPRVLETSPDAQLVFAGTGSDESEIRKIAASSSAAAQIFVAGKVPHNQLEDLYRKAFAYVMPSRQEGFGLVYLEAMNHAKPCIACRDDGGAEVVADEETGLLVNQPIDLDDLTQTLLRLQTDEAAATRMGLAGWHRLNEYFSATAHQTRVASHIRTLLAPVATRPKVAP